MKINKMMLAILILFILGTGYLYPTLPEQIPMHWNLKGEVDQWGHRNSIWLTGLLPTAIYGLMLVVPKLDPRKDSYTKHKRGFSILSIGITLFLLSIHGFVVATALGYTLDIQKFILIGIGLILMLIGNHLPNARQNYTFGIRTPWTLEDKHVWTQTHRIGGVGFVIIGVSAILCAFVPDETAVFLVLGATLSFVAGIISYSYWLYQKLHASEIEPKSK